MAKGAPGLFWVAVLFCTVLAVQRSVSVESGDGARDGLRLSGLDPAGLFLGKAAAVAAQLVVLEVVLGVGVVLLYGARIEVPWLIVSPACSGPSGWPPPAPCTAPCPPGSGSGRPCCPSCCSPSSPRCCWPAPASGRPPWPAAPPRTATPWLRLLIVFDAVYLAFGVVVYGPIQESA